ncbi:MAG TPA: RNA methyltransferase [Candidatus Onthocola stercoravium]|nr:RNA methyltransferase [Candidatus Onthocola stercoravium]
MNITSLQNEHVKYWNSLKEKKVRDKERRFLIEGDHLINEAKRQNLIIETISVIDLAADYLVTEDIMKKISSQTSISYNAAVVRFIPEDSISGNIIILDGIQDPGNLGTIIRSCIAFNFTTIILGDNSVDLYNPKVVRATEGMIFHINVLRRNLVEFIPTLKNLGYKIVGTDVINGVDIKNLKHDDIALVLGSEGQGMSKSVRELCDEFVYINMNESCESLNVGVAASILMYEVNHE